MHTLNRFLTLLVSLAVLLPPATFAFVSLDDRDQAQQSLQTAINSAVNTYRQRGAVQSLLTKGQSMQEKGESHIKQLEEEKRALRQKIVVQLGVIDYVSTHYNVTLTGSGQVAELINTEKNRLVRMVRAQYFNLEPSTATAPGQVVMQSVLHAAAGNAALMDTDTIQSAQMRFLADLVEAQRAFTVLPDLQAQRDTVLADYLTASRQITDGSQIVAHSDTALTDIEKITVDVHDQVLKIQGNLARIDAELKSKAERALIEKGLIDPSTIAASHAVASTPVFHWPAYGQVSAGFMDADYKKQFGVPHLGEDIVVPQASAVYAAADGIVFLVRDGGLTGYSYILIGHRDGYATLYGHVSQALVAAGQEVTAGQQIALSGGTPGMHGSGPMTTAAHLHFEVIRAGVNIDPKSVLP
jgi:murein DD-endopeptidase MepM/ murein hydrolase activator NlpD